jgi:hypothetical protein
MHVLLVQSWTSSQSAIRAELEHAGTPLAITRVDIEPALYAALTNGRFDLVVYDPTTTTLSRAAVDECMRAADSHVPLVVADDLAMLGVRARELARARAS